MNKLFNLLVLAGLPAAACGGSAETQSDKEQGGAGGSESMDSGSGGSGGSGGVSAAGGSTGGAISTGGGTTGSGGELSMGLGGSTPSDCPSAQWTCEGMQCTRVESENLGAWGWVSECVCDPARPTIAADCAIGERFVCDRVATAIEGSPVISCSCVSDDLDEYERCEENNPDYYTISVDPNLCGCAIPLIR